MHAPAAANVTRLPATAQAPAAERFTGSPDEAEAATTVGGFPKIWSPSKAKVMAWVARRMVNVCETSSAGRYVASPLCDAVMSHAPARRSVTEPSATEHAPLAANVTARPEVAVAVTPTGAAPNAWSASPGNAIV